MTHGIPGGEATLAILGLSLASVTTLAALRLLKGPTLPDRVVAFDLLALSVVGLIGLTSILTDEPAFLDAAIVLALLAFIATAAFAAYVIRTGSRRRRWPR